MEIKKTMRSPNAFSGTSTPFSSGLSLNLDRRCTVTESNVAYADFTGSVKGHQHGQSMESLIAELTAGNPEFARHLVAARKRGAEDLFADDKGLRKLRLRAGLSQAELAQACGTTQPYIARYESGGAEPKLSNAKKMAVALNCSLEELTEAFNPGESQ